ncbi:MULTISPECIES: hypothetical protein [Bifidobacterium]|nr:MULTISPECIES: hypothetical protein [Bifidobacterium]
MHEIDVRFTETAVVRLTQKRLLLPMALVQCVSLQQKGTVALL